jgi:NAD(P)-dependent dehydrogenase (short-subunit alcohol dehydrogenase family)
LRREANSSADVDVCRAVPFDALDVDIRAGRVLLIVNVASQCGFTPQYRGLEALYRSAQHRGLTIRGFPWVNIAGIGAARPAISETPDEFRSVIEVNLSGAYWMAQACGRVMAPGSAIVNVSSVLALTTAGLPQAAYSANKAGLLGLTRDLAQQWGTRHGIRVNALAPGFFESEMTASYVDGYVHGLSRRTILRRIGDPTNWPRRLWPRPRPGTPPARPSWSTAECRSRERRRSVEIGAALLEIGGSAFHAFRRRDAARQ